METKKFKLREDITISEYNTTLYRIEALKDFNDVRKGDLGGFVEKEDNLSQKGNCWIYDSAKVYGNAKVYSDAKIFNQAILYGNARVYASASVHDSAEVCDDARVDDNATIINCALVTGRAHVFGNAVIKDSACVCNYAVVCENTCVSERAEVRDKAKVFGNAIVRGDVVVGGNAVICEDVVIEKDTDYYVAKNAFDDSYYTYTRSNKMWRVECFYGTSEELIEDAYEDSKLVGKQCELLVKYVEDLYKLIENN